MQVAFNHGEFIQEKPDNVCEETPISPTSNSSPTISITAVDDEAQHSPPHAHSHSHAHAHGHSHSYSQPTSNPKSSPTHDNGSLSLPASEVHAHSIISPEDSSSASLVAGAYSMIDDPHSGHVHHHAHYIKADGIKFWLTIILMIVLSVHSFIAGLAMGVQSTLGATIDIFVAIIAHKWVEAFALGISMMRDGVPPMRMVWLAALYSIMSPFGSLIGTILMALLEDNAAAIFTAITTGIAAGTFVYIAVVDILAPEFMYSRDKYLKFLFTVVGFILMSGLFMLFDDHHHDDGTAH
jgi:zinc transporter ZupT